MKLLRDILFGVRIDGVSGTTDLEIDQVVFDSRKAGPKVAYVAIKEPVDGHGFIPDVVSKGASAIVCEETPAEPVQGITYVKVPNSNRALAIMAANYYDNPSKNLKLIGVTGTNGKTTVTSLLYQLFKKAGYKVGLLSTIKVMVDDEVHSATHTTPDA